MGASGSEVHSSSARTAHAGPATRHRHRHTRARAGDEVAAASALVGVASRESGFRDGDLENDVRFRALLVERIRRHRPDLVMGHDPRPCSSASTTSTTGSPKRWLGAPRRRLTAAGLRTTSCGRSAHQVPLVFLSGRSSRRVGAVDETIDVKVAAVDCHKSQFAHRGGWASEAIRLRAADEAVERAWRTRRASGGCAWGVSRRGACLPG